MNKALLFSIFLFSSFLFSACSRTPVGNLPVFNQPTLTPIPDDINPQELLQILESDIQLDTDNSLDQIEFELNQLN